MNRLTITTGFALCALLALAAESHAQQAVRPSQRTATVAPAGRSATATAPAARDVRPTPSPRPGTGPSRKDAETTRLDAPTMQNLRPEMDQPAKANDE